MMLLHENDVTTTVDSIPLWSHEFLCECEYILVSFGFRIDRTQGDLRLVSPKDNDWRIQRSRSTPFLYRIKDKPDMFNPQFVISFRNRRVVTIEVCVLPWSTTYDAKWSHEILRSIPEVGMIDKIHKVPPDLYGLIEEYLIG